MTKAASASQKCDGNGTYRPPRSRNLPVRLQVDGYEAYGQFGKPDRPGGPSVLAYCWAHARRGFFDAAKDYGAATAREALRRIGALYDIERELHGRSPDERLSGR